MKGAVCLKSKIIISVQAIVIASLIVCVGWLGCSRKPETESASLDTADEQNVTEILDGDVPYPTTGEKIYLDMAGVGEMWIPVLANVPACERDPEQHVTRNGQVFYLEDDKISSVLGVDVSSYQGNIDWAKVKESGIRFAMIRCGYRGYGSGEIVVDEAFHQNMQGAIDAGLDVGVYFYSQAITPEEAAEEANMTLSLLKDYEITYPVVYDWEIVSSDAARTDGISVEALTNCTIAFCDTVKDAGYIPMVYQNKRVSLLKLDLPALTGYDFWLAEYNDQATYYYNYRMWQYCSDGKVPGISTACDMNICFTPYGND